MGQDQNYTTPGIGLPADLGQSHMAINARDSASKQTLFDGAVEGHVLVKNTRNVLPLRKPKMISVFGYDAVSPSQNDPGLFYANGFEPAQANIYAAAASLGVNTGNASLPSQIAAGGTLINGGGSGANSPPYISSPLDSLQAQAYEDNTSIFWDTSSELPVVSPQSDACLVFINAFATERIDRTGLHDVASDNLVKNVAAICNNTIVVIHNAGVRLVDQFAEHPNVTAIIFAHLPGQDSGRALVSLLYGKSSFSGKLPYSVPKNESDFGLLEMPSQPTPPFELFPQSNFTEGLLIDYRRFDALNITTRYEFGFGLSYTTFSYSQLSITKIPNANKQSYPRSAIISGGRADLWDVLASIELQVSNIGLVNGQEVVQLYVGIPYPNTPVRQLRGFAKISVDVGGSTRVHFDVTRRSLSIWDVQAQEWMLPGGVYNIYVGASSRDLRLNGTLTL
jgi:beta-glucosidase